MIDERKYRAMRSTITMSLSAAGIPVKFLDEFLALDRERNEVHNETADENRELIIELR